jgi:hypothetical protein
MGRSDLILRGLLGRMPGAWDLPGIFFPFPVDFVLDCTNFRVSLQGPGLLDKVFGYAE